MTFPRFSTMKKSRRLLAVTFLCIYCAIFLFVGVNRATEHMGYFPEHEMVRTSDADLAALRDFSRIESHGDFNLEVVQGPVFSVTYDPPSGEPANFEAEVANGLLIMKGWGNRREQGNGVVRIEMPDLQAVHSDFHPQLSISGFDGEALTLNLSMHRSVRLTRNHFGRLDIKAGFIDDLSLAGTSADSEHLEIGGQVSITR